MKQPQNAFPASLWRSFFYSPIASVVTIGLFLLIGAAGWYAWKWGVSDAIFRADFKACMNNHDGACWGFVAEKWRLILFGRFPYDEQWRAAAATGGVILLLVISAFPQLWNRTGCKILTAGWILVLGAFFVLMLGGCFGLSKIDPDYWGGLPLTVILTLFGMTASTPLGILLALGRRSKMSAVRMLCIGYIELVRGVPLITVLFVASFIFPLILPPGFRIDAFWRIVIGIVLFQAAYMAETIRGGLQTIPKGQYEAAASLGLSKYQIYTSVILPQALVTVIPAFVNNLLSTFMDTSLVTIVSMYDLTGSLRLALGDPNWRNFFLEGYLFIAIIYFVFSLDTASGWKNVFSAVKNRLRSQQKRNINIMALKEVFQHSIALCDIDPQLAGVTCKQVWEALKTAYLNRHEYLDFFLDSKPLKTETVGKKEKIDLEIKLSGQNGGQTIVEHHELDPEKSITTTIDATATGTESQLKIVLEEASEGYALNFTYSQNLDESQSEQSPEEKEYRQFLFRAWAWKDREICKAAAAQLEKDVSARTVQ